MAAEIIAFRYYNPVRYHASTVLGLLVLVAGTYWLLESYAAPAAIGAMLLLFGLVIGALVLAGKFLQDLAGEFAFEQDRVTLKTRWRAYAIPFADLDFVAKQFYAVRNGLVAQLSPGQYNIRQISGKQHLLRIARSEEVAYARAISRLNKKIYRTNWLGVQFVTSLPSAEKAAELDRQFAAEEPVFEASLASAIALLVEKSGCHFIDLTA